MAARQAVSRRRCRTPRPPTPNPILAVQNVNAAVQRLAINPRSPPEQSLRMLIHNEQRRRLAAPCRGLTAERGAARASSAFNGLLARSDEQSHRSVAGVDSEVCLGVEANRRRSADRTGINSANVVEWILSGQNRVPGGRVGDCEAADIVLGKRSCD